MPTYFLTVFKYLTSHVGLNFVSIPFSHLLYSTTQYLLYCTGTLYVRVRISKLRCPVPGEKFPWLVARPILCKDYGLNGGRSACKCMPLIANDPVAD
jgi:hypothetical protein